MYFLVTCENEMQEISFMNV